jgi:putative transposase
MMLFELTYNEEHLHSAVNFFTPAQRHHGVDAKSLAKREAVYERAKSLNPGRWSGDIRNWAVVGAVSLNLGKLKEIERNKQAVEVQLFGQLSCKSSLRLKLKHAYS